MARPKISRNVSALPFSREFRPKLGRHSETVTLALEEYETIRLLDYEGLSQEEAAVRLGVARTTVTNIYSAARCKVAEALVAGKTLLITGGAFDIKGESFICGIEDVDKVGSGRKRPRSNIMKIAVPFDNGNVNPHVGNSAAFKFFEVKNKKIVSSEIVPTGGVTHHALIAWLIAKNPEVLLCDSVGAPAVEAFAQKGIAVFPGVTGPVDAAVASFLDGALKCTVDPSSKSCASEKGTEHSCGCGGDEKSAKDSHGCVCHGKNK